MFDLKLFRINFSSLKEKLKARLNTDTIIKFIYIKELDIKYLKILKKVEKLRMLTNKQTKRLGILKTTTINIKERDTNQEIEALKKILTELKTKRSSYENEFKNIKNELKKIILEIPNFPDDETIKVNNKYKILKVVDFPNKKQKSKKDHLSIGCNFSFFEVETAVKMSASKFIIYKQKGATLVRALVDFMISSHKEKGYQEYLFPFLNNYEAFVGSGHFPKFEKEVFKVDKGRFFLIPTAEVPLVNFFRNKNLDIKNLPLKLVSFSPCFRREAGSSGSLTKGLIRLHQFYKVELLRVVLPISPNFNEEFEEMIFDCAYILEQLEISYRIVLLPAHDLAFAAAKTIDLEVWFPSKNDYVEISSISNCKDFQARRVNCRLNKNKLSEVNFPYIFNGSGLAIDRLIAAILENFYDEKINKILIPKILKKFLKTNKKYF